MRRATRAVRMPGAPGLEGERRRRPSICQLGFGHGSHFCLGAHLARIELQVALTSLFGRFPELRLAIPNDEVEGKDGSAVWGLQSLPVVF